ncbi:hypothetical protein MPTK1_5g05470 [Marchantia polymorpha subsp. ruderalis]|nr:hypothetical protein MARPO_0027s0078 [Marchantia polymorpha]BBN10670.1 hypothetical protein Mp_5g05470 [Marchantia polymorpha subsp. ruderalis]|eukprot:PTQ42963.1 hypothetical protein MARPO_0027s0078 [Marchantia polymorpha]
MGAYTRPVVRTVQLRARFCKRTVRHYHERIRILPPDPVAQREIQWDAWQIALLEDITELQAVIAELRRVCARVARITGLGNNWR